MFISLFPVLIMVFSHWLLFSFTGIIIRICYIFIPDEVGVFSESM